MAVWRVLRDYLIVILVAGSVALFFRAFIFEAYRIPGEFMAPGLRAGDVIFINKMTFSFKQKPKHGDVVLFSLFADPQKEYLKRVTAVAGESVELKNCILFLNDKNASTFSNDMWNEGQKIFIENIVEKSIPIIWGDTCTDLPRVVVPQGHVFVMSDNRTMGQDSRHWGFLPITGLKGRAAFIWYAKDRSRMLKRVQ